MISNTSETDFSGMKKEENILRERDRCRHATPCCNRCVGCGYTLDMFCQVGKS